MAEEWAREQVEGILRRRSGLDPAVHDMSEFYLAFWAGLTNGLEIFLRQASEAGLSVSAGFTDRELYGDGAIEERVRFEIGDKEIALYRYRQTERSRDGQITKEIGLQMVGEEANPSPLLVIQRDPDGSFICYADEGTDVFSLRMPKTDDGRWVADWQPVAEWLIDYLGASDL